MCADGLKEAKIVAIVVGTAGKVMLVINPVPKAEEGTLREEEEGKVAGKGEEVD